MNIPAGLRLAIGNSMNSGIGAAAAASSAIRLAVSKDAESCAASVYEINPVSDSRWESFIDGHPRSSVFHSTNWLRALQAAYGYDPLVVTTCSPDAALTNGL